jgi:hypothetical protein
MGGGLLPLGSSLHHHDPAEKISVSNLIVGTVNPGPPIASDDDINCDAIHGLGELLRAGGEHNPEGAALDLEISVGIQIADPGSGSGEVGEVHRWCGVN